MKKLICLALAVMLCLSGLSLAEEEGDNGLEIEYPSLGFTLRLLNKYMDDIKGLVCPGIALALNSESDFVKILLGDEIAKTTEVGIFTASYFCLTQEEYEANEESGSSNRNLEAEIPFISLLVVKDGLTEDDIERIVGAKVDSYEETIMNLLSTKNIKTKEGSNQEDKPTYTVRVVDQNGDPVPEAAVGFCLDTGCVPVETDENGIAVYSGAPARYHIKVVDAPDEYDYPDDTDFYLGPESGEFTLIITKE